MNAVSGKNKAKVLEAVQVFRKAKAWLHAIELDNSICVRLLGELQVRQVMFIHQKKVKTRKQYSSLDEIAHDFVIDVQKAIDYNLHPSFILFEIMSRTLYATFVAVSRLISHPNASDCSIMLARYCILPCKADPKKAASKPCPIDLKVQETESSPTAPIGSGMMQFSGASGQVGGWLEKGYSVGVTIVDNSQQEFVIQTINNEETIILPQGDKKSKGMKVTV